MKWDVVLPSDARRVFLLALILMLFGARPAGASTTGNLSGHVYDVQGQPLQGATVQLITLRYPFELNRQVDLRYHEVQVRQTSPSGFFVFLSLEPGFYQLRSIAAGKYFECPPRVAIYADQTSYVQLFMFDQLMVSHCDEDTIFGPP